MRRAAALALACTVVLGAAVSSAGARTPTKPSAKYCDAFEDYDLIVRVSYFSHGSGWEEEFGLTEVAPKDREPVMALVWSPRLEDDARVMAATSPKAARKAWKSAADALGDGVALLEDSVGLDDDLIEALHDLDPTDPDIEPFGRAADDRGIGPEEFQRKVVDAAHEFEPKMRDAALGDASRKALDAIRTTGQQCGVLPTPPTSSP